MDRPKYRHSEAFMLMTYTCTNCLYREVIWNSRDGVTPFSCSCPVCNNMMNHVDWDCDMYAPNHELRPGDRFWRDGTPDEAEQIMRRRIELLRDKYPITTDEEARMIEEAHHGIISEFQVGWPVLDSRPEVCPCNCDYRCGGPGRCELSIIECLQQQDGNHYVKDCGHKWDGPWVDLDNGGSVSCSLCGMLASTHDMRVGP